MRCIFAFFTIDDIWKSDLICSRKITFPKILEQAGTFNVLSGSIADVFKVPVISSRTSCDASF